MKIKQPFETLALGLGFSEPMASVSDVAVAPRGLVAAGPALVAGAPVVDGLTITLPLSGGTDGERYLITVQAAAASGELLEREAEVAVVDLTWAVPEGGTSYLTVASFVERTGLDLAVRISDTEGSGRIEAARLGKALADASAEVESYLAARFALPIATVSPLLEGLVFDIALARLWTGDAPESVRDRATAATARLRDLAKGLITLPGAAALTPADASPAPVLTDVAQGAFFSRDRLRSF